ERAPLRPLHSRAAPPPPADADARRVLAAVAVGRLAPRTHPAPAAVVPLGLPRECLEGLPHELRRGAPLRGREILGRQVREVLRVAQPVEELLGHPVAERTLHALEDL